MLYKKRSQLEKLGYCKIENYFTKDLLYFLKPNSVLTSLNASIEHRDRDSVVVGDGGNKALYASTISESLLIYLTPFYKNLTGKNLMPSYSYFRVYNEGYTLRPHVDRPSCQYSATICLDTDQDWVWPFFLTDKELNTVKNLQQPSDIIFYKGMEVEHWRESLEVKHSAHCFLHWVDGDDPNFQPYIFDGRESLGHPK